MQDEIEKETERMASITAAKAELRRTIGASLRSLSQSSVTQQSSVVQRKLFESPEWQRAKNISVYLSMPAGEILTEPIVQLAFKEGKTVFVPCLRKNVSEGPKSVMDMVELYSKEDFAQLEPDRWGIPSLTEKLLPGRRRSPGDDVVEGTGSKLDLIIVPGVAFNRELHRLGHGKGYYDFFLQRYRKLIGHEAMPCLVSLALQEQVLPAGQAIPINESDWPVDVLLVGNGSTFKQIR